MKKRKILSELENMSDEEIVALADKLEKKAKIQTVEGVLLSILFIVGMFVFCYYV